MNDLSKFIQEGAKFMAADRPDIYSVEEAADSLSRWFSNLSGFDPDDDNRHTATGSGGFELTRFVDEYGDSEYTLNRHIISFNPFENDPYIFNWTKNGALTDILDLED